MYLSTCDLREQDRDLMMTKHLNFYLDFHASSDTACLT